MPLGHYRGTFLITWGVLLPVGPLQLYFIDLVEHVANYYIAAQTLPIPNQFPNHHLTTIHSISICSLRFGMRCQNINLNRSRNLLQAYHIDGANNVCSPLACSSVQPIVGCQLSNYFLPSVLTCGHVVRQQRQQRHGYLGVDEFGVGIRQRRPKL